MKRSWKEKASTEKVRAWEEKRAKVREFVKAITGLSAEEREVVARQYPIFLLGDEERGTRPASPCNQILVGYQKPDATMVGGYQQWIAHGRRVRTGETSLLIWRPIFPGKEKEGAETDEKKFILVNVFDVSQTEPIAVLVGERAE